MKKEVFAPQGTVVDLPQPVIKTVEKLQKGLRVNMSRLTAKEMNGVGLCYWYGHHIYLNYEEAVKWYKASAAKRCGKAEFNLYICYEKGTGVVKDMNEALLWLKKAAKHNDAGAQDILAQYYYDGIYVKKNRRHAELWFKKALDNAYKNDVAIILNDFGVKYYRGEYGFQQDKTMAIKCFEKAGELGLSLSIGWLITIYIEDENTERVEYWMKKYRKCAKKYKFITIMVDRNYKGFISGRKHRGNN